MGTVFVCSHSSVGVVEMTDLDRLRDAVVQAARHVLQNTAGDRDVARRTLTALRDALAALDAHPTRATAETVRVAVWRVGDHYELTVPQLLRGNHCIYLGTTTLRLDTEAKR